MLAGHGRMILGLGRIKEAVTALEASVAADVYVPPHRQLLAMALWADGRGEEAELAIRKALALWPRHYALWFLRFYMLAHGGRRANRQDRPAVGKEGRMRIEGRHIADANRRAPPVGADRPDRATCALLPRNVSEARSVRAPGRLRGRVAGDRQADRGPVAGLDIEAAQRRKGDAASVRRCGSPLRQASAHRPGILPNPDPRRGADGEA